MDFHGPLHGGSAGPSMPALRAPFGRIHWASVDSATVPYASFSGAVQSGKRAAAEVLAAG